MMEKQPEIEGRALAELGARQMRAIHALLTGANVDKAAKDAHIGKTTLYRWLKDDTFRIAYRAARQRSQGWIQHRLQRLAAKAVQTLEQMLEDATLPATTKVEVARIVLSLTGVDAKLVREDSASLAENHHPQQSVVTFAAPAPVNGVRLQEPALLSSTSSDVH